MDEPEAGNLTPAQRALLEVWQRHVVAEFVTKRVEDALDTMTDDAYVLHIPVATGGFGKAAVRDFYARLFVPQMPPDIQATPVSQLIGVDRLVEEAVYTFTHSLQMDWMLPGIPPTGRRVEVATVGVIQFRNGMIAHEHIYWDQASVLAQLGLVTPGTPAVLAAESARTVLNPALLGPERAGR